ncbi:MAG: hypothetical protein F6K22_20845 [Okeania sp. SIO2F4]|nr:hypothetical protein [Okeania sp. SIO2F4]
MFSNSNLEQINLSSAILISANLSSSSTQKC